jgi:hypothetical protein
MAALQHETDEHVRIGEHDRSEDDEETPPVERAPEQPRCQQPGERDVDDQRRHVCE